MPKCCHMQVRNVQKKVSQLQKDGEKVLRTQMKKYPALQPYAKTPYTTYILRLGVLVPLFIFLGPLLGLIGSLGKSQQPIISCRTIPNVLCAVVMCERRIDATRLLSDFS